MTHKQKVLQLLSDGQPHTHHEGYALNVMFHSRVADLRKDGYEIACWREGELSMYQLGAVQRGEGSGETSRPAGPSRRMDDGLARHAGSVVFPPPTPEPQSQPVRQLSVFEAA